MEPEVASNLGQLSKQDLIDLIVSIKPRNSLKAKTNKALYWAPKYARTILPAVRQHEVTKHPIIFRYRSYPTYQKNTLYLRTYYSLRYIQETEDREFESVREYAKTLRISKDRVGVVLDTRKANEQPLIFEEFVANELPEDRPWEIKVKDFFAQAEIGERLEINKLRLTQDQFEELEIALSQQPLVIGTVSQSTIKLQRISSEEHAAFNTEISPD